MPTLAALTLKGVDQGKRVGELSGGERGRLHLAKLLQVGGNMLLLDEPTNDLGYRNPACAGKRPAGVPGLRDGYLARPLVPRPYRHAHPGLPGMKVKLSSSKVTLPSTKEYKKRTLGADALEPKRIKYKRIAK